MAIDGDGFFVVQGTEQRFTRDGSFTLNSANQLVTTGGDFVQGFGVDADGNVIAGKLEQHHDPARQHDDRQGDREVTLRGQPRTPTAPSRPARAS